METVTRNAGRKSNARKRAAAVNSKEKTEAAPKSKPKVETKTAPVVDVPNSQQKQINEHIKANKQKVADYMAKHFDEVSEADVEVIAREVAECVILNRSPKAGGVWGSEVDIVEGVITAVQGPKVATVDPAEPLADAGPDKGVHSDEHDQGEPDGEQEESEAAESAAEIEDAPADQDEKALASEPSSDAKTAPTKSKDKKVTSATKKTAAPTKAKAEPTKKPTKAKAKSKADSSDRTPAVSADQIKKLKGKEQWFAAARLLKSQKKLWIQAQDIPDVIGHLYEVSIGKAKLKEEGFEGKGEKVYRRNRILGFKESIEGFLKSLK